MVHGVPASLWSRLEAHYLDQLAKVTEENEMDEDIELSKMFPIAR
jgi:hypothetical protein